MTWTESHIRDIVADMAEENPLACRALLGISEVVFSEQVPTLAVDLSDRPRLLVNLGFCNRHLISETDVKCVLLHEFLHVLMGHTLRYEKMDAIRNLALDAIINATIGRLMGATYTAFFERFYAWSYPQFLLRPMAGGWIENLPEKSTQVYGHWLKIYRRVEQGRISADELDEILEESLRGELDTIAAIPFLGNHQPTKVSTENGRLLEALLQRLGGKEPWDNSDAPDKGVSKQMEPLRRYERRKWREDTFQLIQRCVQPSNRGQRSFAEVEVTLPVAHPSDRRALARALAGPLMPMYRQPAFEAKPEGTTTVYLDVSGSMDSLLQEMVSLLYAFRPYLAMPLYTFSDKVCEARFEDGRLIYETTGGTGIDCVLKHIRKHKVKRCLIVTDGYLGPFSRSQLKGIPENCIHALITHDGSTEWVGQAKCFYRMLEKLRS